LTDEDEAEIRRFVETADIAGGRYFDGAMSQTFCDTKEESYED
jgi:hypothetical protein